MKIMKKKIVDGSPRDFYCAPGIDVWHLLCEQGFAVSEEEDGSYGDEWTKDDESLL